MLCAIFAGKLEAITYSEYEINIINMMVHLFFPEIRNNAKKTRFTNTILSFLFTPQLMISAEFQISTII